jgi:P27 family predicted phage terminase small subunit
MPTAETLTPKVIHMARPRKPTALHVVEGTERPDRSNPEEPQPPVLTGSPRPPTWLKKSRARAAWKRLAADLIAQRLLTTLDPTSLGLLCDAFADYLEAGEVIEREGAYYDSPTEGGGTITRRHPAVEDRKDAWVRTDRMLGRFGMNPVERSRVHAATEAAADPFEQFLARTTDGRRRAAR